MAGSEVVNEIHFKCWTCGASISVKAETPVVIEYAISAWVTAHGDRHYGGDVE